MTIGNRNSFLCTNCLRSLKQIEISKYKIHSWLNGPFHVNSHELKWKGPLNHAWLRVFAFPQN